MLEALADNESKAMRSTRKLEPGEYFWAMLAKTRKRPQHEPHEMRSASSLGPIKAWLCDECAAYVGMTYTYVASDSTPWCFGSSTSARTD